MPPSPLDVVPIDRRRDLIELARRRQAGELRIRAVSPLLTLIAERPLTPPLLDDLRAEIAALLRREAVHVEALAVLPAWRRGATWAAAHRLVEAGDGDAERR